MNRKYPSHAAAMLRHRGRCAAGSNVNWGRTATFVGGGAVGLSIIGFIFSLISAVLIDASNTLNRL